MNKLISYILAVVLTAVIVGGGVYYWQDNKKTSDANLKVAKFNCEQSGGEIKNGKCDCSVLKKFDEFSKYEEGTGYCVTSMGLPGGKLEVEMKEVQRLKMLEQKASESSDSTDDTKGGDAEEDKTAEDSTDTKADIDTNQASYIQISSPKNDAIFYEEPFFVTGTTSTNCDKVVARAVNKDYEINNAYTLTKYKRGDSTFKYGIKHEWKNLDVGKNTYTLTAHCDTGNKSATVNLFYEASGGVEMGKPVVYLYPTEKQEVFVLPKPEGGITVSEPELGDGWNVTAHPDGKIVDQNRKVWPYLFWEGYSDLTTPKEGFLVHKNELNRFFNAKLSHLGLITKEIEDFKEYWLEQLNEDKYYFISFISQAELDAHAPIVVEPKPETVIRVFFDYKTVDAGYRYTEQKLEKGPARDGFTMTEWGGRLY